MSNPENTGKAVVSEAASRTASSSSTPRSATASNRPARSMNLDEKLEVAQALRDLGVDVIEAGLPDRLAGRLRGGPGDRARRFRGRSSAAWPAATTATSTAPGRRSRTRRAAAHPRLPRHQRHPPRVQAEDGQGGDHPPRRRGREAGARDSCDDIEFSPEDAARTELDFLAEVVEAAIEAGATTVNIPDTVGYAMPQHVRGDASRYLKKHVRDIDKAVISVHCHNDLGLAVANSLAGVEGGRAPGRMHDQRHRRAGRQRLARRDRHGAQDAQRLLPRHAPASTPQRLCPTSRLVSHVTGMQVQRNKAIVGQNAFAHEAGIHQDGMLKDREHLRDHAAGGRRLPRDRPGAGQAQRPARAGERLVALGYHLDRRADSTRSSTTSRCWPTRRRKSTTPTSRRSWSTARSSGRAACAWELEALSTTAGTGTLPCGVGRAQERGRRPRPGGRRAATGRSTPSSRPSSGSPASSVKLRDYQIAERHDGRGRPGRGLDRGRAPRPASTAAARLSTDIIEGSARAFLDVMNRIALKGPQQKPDLRMETP